jgi:putative redox protein
MEVRITHLNRVKFSIQSRTHTILCAQPADDGGDDMGMTPPQLFLASLGSCAAFYATQYLRTRSVAVTGVEVSVTAEKLKHPARLGNFRVQVTYPVSLTEEQTEGLMRSVNHCLIHNTLLSQPEFAIELRSMIPVSLFDRFRY